MDTLDLWLITIPIVFMLCAISTQITKVLVLLIKWHSEWKQDKEDKKYEAFTGPMPPNRDKWW